MISRTQINLSIILIAALVIKITCCFTNNLKTIQNLQTSLHGVCSCTRFACTLSLLGTSNISDGSTHWAAQYVHMWRIWNALPSRGWSNNNAEYHTIDNG